MTKHQMPIQADQSRLWGHVASLPCQRGTGGASVHGVYGVHVAHSNQLRDGKGMGLKAYPWRIAAICPLCHTEIDSGPGMTKGERREAWEEAHRNTIGELFRLGLVRPT